MHQKHRAAITSSFPVSGSSIVDRLPAGLPAFAPPRTAEPHGISGRELRRLDRATVFMELHCTRRRTSLWWVTTDAGTSRSIIAAIWKRITRLQRQFRLPQYSVLVFEGEQRERLHAHIYLLGNREVVGRLTSSEAFGQLLDIQAIYDLPGLVQGYQAKFRTPQAGYRRTDLGGRVPGSHPIDGGGDRIRVSVALETDAISAGYVAPWQHTNARRCAERKPYRVRRLTRKALRLSGQLPLLPELDRPVSRLHNFGGGFIPPAVALELEFRRKQLGLSQVQFACRLGISQGQYANAIRGHDPISAFAINRAREAGARGVLE